MKPLGWLLAIGAAVGAGLVIKNAMSPATTGPGRPIATPTTPYAEGYQFGYALGAADRTTGTKTSTAESRNTVAAHLSDDAWMLGSGLGYTAGKAGSPYNDTQPAGSPTALLATGANASAAPTTSTTPNAISGATYTALRSALQPYVTTVPKTLTSPSAGGIVFVQGTPDSMTNGDPSSDILTGDAALDKYAAHDAVIYSEAPVGYSPGDLNVPVGGPVPSPLPATVTLHFAVPASAYLATPGDVILYPHNP